MSSAELHGQALQFTSVDGLSIRYVDTGEQPGPTTLMTSPWPESLLAFRRIWHRLAPLGRLVLVDLPGFGHSEGRADLFSPSAMAEFLHLLIDDWQLDRPHVVAPDVGTSAALFLAARHPASVTSLIVGSGAVAYPVEVTGSVADLLAAPDLDFLKDFDSRTTVGARIEHVAHRNDEADVWEDYVTAGENGRYAECASYVRTFPTELSMLAELLPSVITPVQVISGLHDDRVPASNSAFAHDRLPHCRLTNLDSGHFPWEERAAEYGAAVAHWITGGHAHMRDGSIE